MITHKECTKCEINKPLECFYKNLKSKDGVRSSCIDCSKQYKLENIVKIKEQIRKYNIKSLSRKKEWAEKNKDKVNNSRKKWVDKNPEKEKNRKREYSKKYYEINKEYRLKYSKEKQRKYLKENPIYRFKSNIRRRINSFLKNKSLKTEIILGITYVEFIKYFELKFSEGMSWDKMGKEIHIDHIIPLSSAKTEEEIIKLCHYTNLQPLWAKDNLIKGSKINNK